MFNLTRRQVLAASGGLIGTLLAPRRFASAGLGTVIWWSTPIQVRVTGRMQSPWRPPQVSPYAYWTEGTKEAGGDLQAQPSLPSVRHRLPRQRNATEQGAHAQNPLRSICGTYRHTAKQYSESPVGPAHTG
jgi:hypothetical protein